MCLFNCCCFATVAVALVVVGGGGGAAAVYLRYKGKKEATVLIVTNVERATNVKHQNFHTLTHPHS